MTVRWATIDDIDELVRLRRIMFESMGETFDDDVAAAAADAFRRGLPTGEFFAAVVDGDVGVPGGQPWLAACGVGMVSVRLPGPGSRSGRWGYVQSMVTDERARRRGHARAVMAALLDRFVAEGLPAVELHASTMGEPLYRSMGFEQGTEPDLTWRPG